MLGRMNQVDPLAGKYASINPYNFSFNNPVSFTDPSGAEPIYEGYTVNRYFDGLGRMQDDVIYQRFLRDDGKISGSFLTGFGMNGGHITRGSGGHWADGMQFSDWSSYGGSAIFRGGIAAGLTELGGELYAIKDGNLVVYEEKDGKLGYWVNSNYWDYSEDNGLDPYGNKMPTLNVTTRFVNNGGGVTDFTNSNWALSIGGGIFGSMEGLSASNGYWLGKNGKYYPERWGGNQHTGSRAGAFKAANFYKNAGRAAIFVSAAIGVYSTIEGYQADGGQFGYNTQMAAVSSTGGILGGIAGAKAGVAFGAAVGVWFGGVGAIPGAVIGGVAGGLIFGFGGGYLGGQAGEAAVNYYHGR